MDRREHSLCRNMRATVAMHCNDIPGVARAREKPTNEVRSPCCILAVSASEWEPQ